MITMVNDPPQAKTAADTGDISGVAILNRGNADGKSIVYTELGTTGLDISGGRVLESRLQNFKGPRRAIVIREMSETDSTVKGLLSNFVMLGRAVSYSIVPGGESAADDEAAEFVDQCLKDMETSWSDTLTAIFSMLPFGYSWLEQNYKWRHGDEEKTIQVPDPSKPAGSGQMKEIEAPKSNYNDGKIGWWGWPIRLQETIERWDTDESGRVKGVFQRAKNVLQTERYIPIKKALHFRTSAARGNPEGESLLECAYRAWYFKRNFEEIVGIGVKRDLTGLLHLAVPKEWEIWTAAGASKLLELERFLSNIARDEYEGAITPDNTKLELLGSGGQRQFDVKGLINMLRLEIAIGTLTEFALIGHEGSGSLALKREATRVFLLALQGILESGVAETINRFAIPPLMKLNGFPVTQPPKLVFGNVDIPTVEVIIESLVKLAGIGATIFPNDEILTHIFGNLRLPTTEALELQAQAAKEKEEMAAVMAKSLGGGSTDDAESDDAENPEEEAGENDEVDGPTDNAGGGKRAKGRRPTE